MIGRILVLGLQEDGPGQGWGSLYKEKFYNAGVEKKIDCWKLTVNLQGMVGGGLAGH